MERPQLRTRWRSGDHLPEEQEIPWWRFLVVMMLMLVVLLVTVLIWQVFA